jgi:hypothetical protein
VHPSAITELAADNFVFARSLSVLVTVGETDSWVGELVEKAKALKVGNGFDPEVEV